MTKAIDMRVRPPYKKMREATILRHVATEGHRRDIEKINHQIPVSIPVSALAGDMDLFMAEMKDADIEIGVMPLRVYSGLPHVFYDQTEILELCNKYPGKFIAVPQIDPIGLPEYAERDFNRMVQHGPCNTIYMEAGQRVSPIPTDIDDERLFPWYEKCQNLDVRIIMQVGSCRNTTVHNRAEMMEHILNTFPKLKICASHGAWPMTLDYLRLALASSNFVISPDWYFGIVPGSRDYQDAANGWLQDSILFGSSYPLCDMKNAVNMYEKFVSPDVLPKIMYENAAKFMGLR